MANTTLGPPTVTRSQQSDGTTTVTSTLLLRRSETAEQAAATCVVRHPGLQVPLRATLDPSLSPTNHGSCHLRVGVEWWALTFVGLFSFWHPFRL